MGIAVAGAKLFNRRPDGLSVLAQAAIMMLLINPQYLATVSFQLSFGATFGLIYAAQVFFPLASNLRGVTGWAIRAVIVTGGAQLAVSPILIMNFHTLSVWGIPSNLLALVPSFLLLVLGGVLSLGMDSIPLLGELLIWLVRTIAGLLDGIAWFFARLPGSDIAVPHPPVWMPLFIFAIMLILGELIRNWRELHQYRQHWIAVLLGLALIPAVFLITSLFESRDRLIAYQLGRAEGYLLHSRQSGALLLLHPAWLRSNHNVDTIMDGLRYFGIAQPDAIIWLDDAEYELETFSSISQYAYGSELPAQSDVCWYQPPASRKPVGVVVNFRSRQYGIITHDLPLSGANWPAGTLLVHYETWQKLEPVLRARLDDEHVVFVIGKTETTGLKQTTSFDRQLVIR
jgi:hypothetical protein